jgi:3-isopropylmalate/(R)-2-methylmalate dehydratase large subunit
MGLTIVQKILRRFTGDDAPKVGDLLVAEVSAVMISEALGPKFFDAEFIRLGGRLFDREKIVVVIDHYSPAASIEQAEFNRYTEDWAIRNNVKHFYRDYGPNPQVMAEGGFFQPGTVVVGNDSHTCTGGAFGALAAGVGTTAIACAAATGKVWLRVPETVKVTWRGELAEAVSAKDMALCMIGHFGSNRLIYKAVELEGSCIRELSMDSRMTLCNMAVEMGAKAEIIAPDDTTRTATMNRTEYGDWGIKADPDADYEEDVEFDAGALEPMVAAPHHVANVKPVRDVEGRKIDQGFIGSCTGGRYEDLRTAAAVLKGKKVSPGVRLIVCPASRSIWERAVREGLLEDLSKAGAVISYPSCGPCGAAQGGLIAAGEVCVTASNRNFKGRMGSTMGEVYLASPATVAASALAGRLADPRNV